MEAKIYLTIIRAVCPETGELKTYEGIRIAASDIEAAKAFVKKEYPYMKVVRALTKEELNKEKELEKKIEKQAKKDKEKPSTLTVSGKIAQEIQKLRRQLKQAEKNQEFEKCSKIMNQIKKLKEELGKDEK